MPCRRPHRKSRLGCKNCKAKRTKCDEVHPICGNCIKYDLQCDFAVPANAKPLSTTSLPPVKIPALRMSQSRQSTTSPIASHPTSEDAVLLSSKSQALQLSTLSPSSGRQPWTQRPISLTAMTMGTPQDRLLELRLMHHFTSMVSTTLFRLIGSNRQVFDHDGFPKCTSSPSTHDLLNLSTRHLTTPLYINPLDIHSSMLLSNEHDNKRNLVDLFVGVTSLAIRTPPLMDALLGFSAFNLRRLQHGTDKELSLASHKYMTRAISSHAQQLRQGIHPETAEVLFAGSALIAFSAISSHEYISPEDDSALPLHWFRPWQGVRSVAREAWKYIQAEEITRLLQSERNSFLDLEERARASNSFDFLLADLDRNLIGEETLIAYECSVYWLSLLRDNPEQDYCFKFTAKVPPKFVQMLTEHDPRTLTIVGYFFMVLRMSEQVWWLPRTTGKEFWNLMNLLPEEWKPRMAWAVSVFGETTEG